VFFSVRLLPKDPDKIAWSSNVQRMMQAEFGSEGGLVIERSGSGT